MSVYAAFGIPLNVIFLADVGYLFAKAIVKIIRAIKLCKRRRRRAKKEAEELRRAKKSSSSGRGSSALSDFFRRRRKVAKRGKKFKYRSRGPPPPVKPNVPTVSRPPVLDNNDGGTGGVVKDTSLSQDNITMVNQPNGGRDLFDPLSDVTSIEKPTYVRVNRPRKPIDKKKPKSSGGLSASRNMSVHARSLRRRAPPPSKNEDDDEIIGESDGGGHYTKQARTTRKHYGGGGGGNLKRREGGISASRHMSVHSRSLNRHRPEDVDESDEEKEGDENIKTVSEGLGVMTHDFLQQQSLGIPSSKSDEQLVSNDQLSISMRSEATDNTSEADEDDGDSVDTEVPTIIVLTILITYICVGAVMMMYIEDWHYGEAVYFTIITLTTIGFGDMAPIQHYSEETLFSFIIFTVFGLAVMSTCIALVQAKVLRAIDKVTRKIRKHAEL